MRAVAAPTSLGAFVGAADASPLAPSLGGSADAHAAGPAARDGQTSPFAATLAAHLGPRARPATTSSGDHASEPDERDEEDAATTAPAPSAAALVPAHILAGVQAAPSLTPNVTAGARPASADRRTDPAPRPRSSSSGPRTARRRSPPSCGS